MAQTKTQTTKQARALRAKKQKILIFPKISSAFNAVVLLLCLLSVMMCTSGYWAISFSSASRSMGVYLS